VHIVVCIKSVIERMPEKMTERSGDILQLNPYDIPAIGFAVSLAKQNNGKVTVISMGPEDAGLALRDAVALGADRAVLVCDRAFAGSDTLATSTVLCGAIKKLGGFDLLVFGTRSSDSDTGQVGPQTAALLDIPLITSISSATFNNNDYNVLRSADGFKEEFLVSTPAALTVDPSAIDPEEASLCQIREAYDNTEVEVFTLHDLGLDADHVGDNGSPTKVLKIMKVTKDRTCKLIEGDIDSQADELINELHEKGLL
jgi:electron transfer flavoprotein beta subunit